MAADNPKEPVMINPPDPIQSIRRWWTKHGNAG